MLGIIGLPGNLVNGLDETAAAVVYWMRHKTTNPGIAGSIPHFFGLLGGGGTRFLLMTFVLVGS